MNDMRPVLAPKSDQINADDLAGGPVTITIREVRISAGQEQPVSVYFEGSDKAFRPCKTMGRALMELWGPDAGKYIGHSLTLYRDPNVKFGKDAVGGVRISHATGITERKVMMLTATRGQRKPHAIMPLEMAPANESRQQRQTPAEWVDAYIADVNAAETLDALAEIQQKAGRALTKLEGAHPDLYAKAVAAGSAKADQLNPAEGRTDEDHGDQHDGSEQDAPF